MPTARELQAELDAIDEVLNRVNAAQHPDRATRILHTLEHIDLVADAAIFDAWKRVHCLLKQRDHYALMLFGGAK